MHVFMDRSTAGRELGQAVVDRALKGPFLVLGLPRGGVPVALEVARALDAPLDVMVVRKIGMPGQPELAIGAIASGDVTVRESGVGEGESDLELAFDRLAARERVELARRERAYRGDAPPVDATGRTVILVDDGLATGATMIAAVRAARKAGADAVIAAAPVASRSAASRAGAEADETVILEMPAGLYSIGEWYEHFGQLDDAEVRDALERVRRTRRRPDVEVSHP